MDRDDKGRFPPGTSGNPNGRPKKDREEQYHAILLSVVTPASWKRICVKAVEQAEKGDRYAREFIADYLIGPPVQKQEHTGLEGGPLRIVYEYAGDTDDAEATEDHAG